MKIEIQAVNLAQVMKKIGKLTPAMKVALQNAIEKGAMILEKDSKKNTPVDTGRLRASIYSTIKPLSATVQPKTDYAVFVHEGTRFMKGRPYMRQAVDSNEKRIEDVFVKEIEKAIKKTF